MEEKKERERERERGGREACPSMKYIKSGRVINPFPPSVSATLGLRVKTAPFSAESKSCCCFSAAAIIVASAAAPGRTMWLVSG